MVEWAIVYGEGVEEEEVVREETSTAEGGGGGGGGGRAGGGGEGEVTIMEEGTIAVGTTLLVVAVEAASLYL